MSATREVAELARRCVRSVLGYDNWLYRNAASILDASSLLVSEAPQTVVQLRKLKTVTQSPRSDEAIPVKFRRLKHPIYLRSGSRDVDTLISNAVREEYGQLDIKTHPDYFIVDAGAYIGDTSSYFLSRYPNATVVALEPNPDSITMAERNLTPYGGRVSVINKALSDRPGTLFMSGSQTGARVGESGSVEVECITVHDLLTLSPSGRIDILKLDIEGAEEKLFRENASGWLDSVGHIIVETHGLNCDLALFAALEAANWTHRQYRNLYYCSPKA